MCAVLRSLGLLGVVTVLAFACTPPGKGPKAEGGYRRATPVIEALERYHVDIKQYPEALEALVPEYLSQVALAPPRRQQEHYPFEYERTPSGYSLSFRYAGPGMNRCTYRSAAPRWECSGYF